MATFNVEYLGKEDEPIWKKCLYIALECRKKYLGLLKVLPNHELEEFPSYAVLDRLENDTDDFFKAKDMQFISRNLKGNSEIYWHRDAENAAATLWRTLEAAEQQLQKLKPASVEQSKYYLYLKPATSRSGIRFLVDKIRNGYPNEKNPKDSIFNALDRKIEEAALYPEIIQWLKKAKPGELYEAVFCIQLVTPISNSANLYLTFYFASNELAAHTSDSNARELVICDLTDKDIEQKLNEFLGSIDAKDVLELK